MIIFTNICFIYCKGLFRSYVAKVDERLWLTDWGPNINDLLLVFVGKDDLRHLASGDI